MEVILGILAFIVAVLAVLQGYSMIKARRAQQNTDDDPAIAQGLNDISTQLGNISARLGRMEQRLNDVWDKVKGQ